MRGSCLEQRPTWREHSGQGPSPGALPQQQVAESVIDTHHRKSDTSAPTESSKVTIFTLVIISYPENEANRVGVLPRGHGPRTSASINTRLVTDGRRHEQEL